MARAKLSPEAAAAAISEVGTYRQGMTARAAGTLWIIWGLAMAGAATIELAVDPGAYEAPQGTGEGVRLADGAFPMLVVWLTFIVGGIIATNVIWRAHAIAREERHRPWVAWLVGGAVVLAFVFGTFALAQLLAQTWEPQPGGQDEFAYVFVTPILTATAALALTIALRRRISMWPGLIVVALLVAFEVMVPVLFGGDVDDQLLAAVVSHVALTVASFSAAGLFYFGRG